MYAEVSALSEPFALLIEIDDWSMVATTPEAEKFLSGVVEVRILSALEMPQPTAETRAKMANILKDSRYQDLFSRTIFSTTTMFGSCLGRRSRVLLICELF